MARRRSSGLRIVVLGYIVRGPIGGLAWHHLQYVMGLARLGHEVAFIEDSDEYPSCYDPVRGVTGADPSFGLGFAARAFRHVGLARHWAYHDAHARCWHGPLAERARTVCCGADLVLNLSGMNPLRPWLAEVPARVLVDTDPVFTQIRHLSEPAWRERALLHTAFFTFGENLPGSSPAFPDDGLPWQPTRQPVVLDAWPLTRPPPDAPFTTVMVWDSYPERSFGGRRFGMKSAAFGPYMDLPGRTATPLELALGGAAPRARLEGHGWRLREALAVSRDPWSYQRYIQASRAEFSVAKQGYVAARSGWFSERSAAYLASGRPVVVQDTGFSDWLGSGRGVIAFATPEQACAGIESVARNYDAHANAARALAQTWFDSGPVLERLIERSFQAQPAPALP